MTSPKWEMVEPNCQVVSAKCKMASPKCKIPSTFWGKDGPKGGFAGSAGASTCLGSGDLAKPRSGVTDTWDQLAWIAQRGDPRHPSRPARFPTYGKSHPGKNVSMNLGTAMMRAMRTTMEAGATKL